MKKYYFNDGTGQQGPFTLEELQAKNIHAETPVWYDGLTDWTTAGKVEELKDILVHTPPEFHAVTPAPVEEVKPVIPVAETPVTPVVVTAATVTVTETPAPAATIMASTAPAKSAKKSTAWLSYVLGLLVLGGVGFLVYQDMDKNKGVSSNMIPTTMVTDSTASTTTQQPATDQPSTTTTTTNTAGNSDTAKTETNTTEPATTTTATTEPATTGPATTTTTTPTSTTPTTSTQPATTVTTTKTNTQPVSTKPTAATLKAQQLEAQKLAQKKADDEKKKLAAQAAAAAKEKDYRNNWPKYVTFGRLDYDATHDGVDAFNVPVYNGTNAMLDKVTVRVDYMKKDKRVVKSETIIIYNIPPGAGLNGTAPELRKVNNINIKAFFTGITSRKLHFCYPANNGNAADPYYCN